MKKEIETLSSRSVYKNNWMTVREDVVRFADGHEGIFGVVDKPDFALILPLHDNGEIQLVEQYRYPVEERYWELPQGSVATVTDGDMALVARIELEEETGLKAETLEPMGRFFQACGFLNQSYHLFLATGLSAGEPRHEIEEQGMITRSFELAKIIDMIQKGQIRDAPSVAAIGQLRLMNRI